MCRKSFVLEDKFSSNIERWQKMGHGLYLFGSNGKCFNSVDSALNDKKFSFGSGRAMSSRSCTTKGTPS